MGKSHKLVALRRHAPEVVEAEDAVGHPWGSKAVVEDRNRDGIKPVVYAEAIQRTPDPRLWCIRTDGEMAVMTYERDQNIFSWCRYVTDGVFESVSVIFGGARSEDEIWVTVKRVIEGSDKRYIERFTVQEFDAVDAAVMVDSAKIVASAFTVQNIIVASDTVRCNNGLANSSLCGGVVM